jgi:hypothetical protein
MGKKSRLKKLERETGGNNLKTPPIPDNISSAIFDGARKHLLLLTDDILLNQLRRDCPKIAETFDSLCEVELEKLSKVFSRSTHILFAGVLKMSEKEFFIKTSMILMNASSSLVAATQLLRNGFVLQPAMLVRSIVEQVATALHLMAYPADLARLSNGKFDSSKTISTANRMLPIFGKLYGYFSDGFTHVGSLHTDLQPVSMYHDRNPALVANLQFLGTAALLIEMTAELLFFSAVDSHRYWKKLDVGKYVFEPSNEAFELIDLLTQHALKHSQAPSSHMTKLPTDNISS